MLTEGEAQGLRLWVDAANGWSVAAQKVVESSTELATVSRELADVLSANGGAVNGTAALPTDLRSLAVTVEADTAELRNRYLSTAASIGEFKDFVD